MPQSAGGDDVIHVCVCQPSVTGRAAICHRDLENVPVVCSDVQSVVILCKLTTASETMFEAGGFPPPPLFVQLDLVF